MLFFILPVLNILLFKTVKREDVYSFAPMPYMSDSSTLIILVANNQSLLQKCVLFITTTHHIYHYVFLLFPTAWVKIHISFQRGNDLPLNIISSMPSLSSHINNLKKNSILSNTIDCNLSAMSYYPLVWNKLFKDETAVYIIIPPKAILCIHTHLEFSKFQSWWKTQMVI